jgi:hypothetical protein
VPYSPEPQGDILWALVDLNMWCFGPGDAPMNGGLQRQIGVHIWGSKIG